MRRAGQRHAEEEGIFPRVHARGTEQAATGEIAEERFLRVREERIGRRDLRRHCFTGHRQALSEFRRAGQTRHGATVIASVSEAIQGHHWDLDCFVAIAPRNDEVRSGRAAYGSRFARIRHGCMLQP